MLLCSCSLGEPFAIPYWQVLTGEQEMPEGFHRRPKGVALVSDIDDGTKADVDLPSPTKAGAIEVRKGEDGKPLANGQAGDPDKPDWGKTGWEPRFGWPSDPEHEGESMLDHATWVESQLSEQFFGGTAPCVPDRPGAGSVEADNRVTQIGTTTPPSLPLPALPHG